MFSDHDGGGKGHEPTFSASELHTRIHTCCMGKDDTTGDRTTWVTGIDATDVIIGDATGRIIGEAPYAWTPEV